MRRLDEIDDLRDVLCNVSQIFNGWRGDECWSVYDEEIAQRVVAIQRAIDEVPQPAQPPSVTREVAGSLLERLKIRRVGACETPPCHDYQPKNPSDYGIGSCVRCGWAEPEHFIDELEIALRAALKSSPAPVSPESDQEHGQAATRVDESAQLAEPCTAANNELARARATIQRLNRRCQLAEAAANLRAEQWWQRSKEQGRLWIWSQQIDAIAALDLHIANVVALNIARKRGELVCIEFEQWIAELQDIRSRLRPGLPEAREAQRPDSISMVSDGESLVQQPAAPVSPVAQVIAEMRAEAAEFQRGLGNNARTNILNELAAKLEAVLRSSPSPAAPVDNGNAFAFCDYVHPLWGGCVRGAGHDANGHVHLRGADYDTTRGPVVLFSPSHGEENT